jgi:signal transduction histidine kinase/ActR/RegA family two-component response regulator
MPAQESARFIAEYPLVAAVALLAAGILGLLFALALAHRRRLARLAARIAELERAAELAGARETALRQADRVKDEFLAVLAHELRNPLAAMSSAAYLMRKIAPEGKAQEASGIVSRQVEQMNRLIEDLLDVTRVTRGKVSLSRAPIDLARLAEKTLEEMRLAGRLARHEVRAEVASAWVRADDARLQQVVTNLVGNAVKYTPEGGRIVVTVRRERDEAILRVHDSGAGMSPELAARVFDLFVQGELSQRRGGGLGIGLTLVKHLVELHGGKVFAASGGEGVGSVFTVTLPAIEAQADALPAAPAAPLHAACHRILLVEDHADSRRTMFAALEEEGHRVFEAADGVAALRAVEAVKPDVAIVDLGLPQLDGYAVASALRDSPARERMVLIAMTGLERPDTLRRAREAGFDEYLSKPVAPDRLVRAIDAALARKPRPFSPI